VALLVETARGYGRAFLRGIVRYARLHGPWSFYLTPGDFEQELPRMRAWGGTGIIARIETPAVARAILAARLPTIALDLTESQLRPSHPLSALAEVSSDSAGAARMAADHLIERGLRSFAFVADPGRVWSDRRERAFVTRVREAGFDASVHHPPRRPRHAERNWGEELPELVRWLQQLPRPVGLMASNDDRGREVLEAARAASLRVPEDLAVIGVDNDELLCDLADPPLSSVALNAEAGGYRTAELLDQMMHASRRASRRNAKPARLVVEPTCVVTRRSTDIRRTDDTLVAEALQFLHDHAAELSTGVPSLVRALGVSRRSLEIRFKSAMGRTLRDELERLRIDRVRRLLAETDWPLDRLARASGFASGSYLAQAFRRATGSTPATYRRTSRGE
jgi:LacI family transcriptional regulator